MMKQAYAADLIFDGNIIRRDHVILTEGNVVLGILPIESIPSDFAIRSFSDCLIAPAFVDLQIYGGNGKLFSHSPDQESLEATYSSCKAGGCSHFMITMATHSTENFFRGIDAALAYISSGKKGLLGLHLEGPWISRVKKGAHVESFIYKPVKKDVDSFLQKSKSIVKMVTLAPEECEDDIIRALMDNGIIVSAGHSNASYSRARHVFNMGVPAATHLFNAMSPLQGREPGMVGAIYDDPNVMSSIICDGVHVDFASIKISKKLMGERLFFITDAVTTIKEGYYQHEFHGDRYTLPDGTLSGSCMTMISTFKNAVQKVGIPINEALKMCSTDPAGLLKDPFLGRIQAGQNTDFNIINKTSLDLVESVFQ
jgi:N-acetylglucosamine-6-phosphate deacetylase